MAEKNHGPMRGNARGPRPNVKDPGKLLLRLLSYIFKNYGFACIVVVICLFITVFSSVQGTLFMQTLIDDYIIPLTKQASPDFTELAHAIGRVAVFYACGVLASFAQSKIMVYVTQGTLRNLRNDMFIHMEGLPIRYFDTHPHGDIMSTYTNDIDTLQPDDQSEYPAGFKQCGYDCQRPWRHDRFKHPTDDHHTFYGWSHALCHQSGRWRQCQVLYRPAA